MAKKSSIEKNKRRAKLAKQYAAKRARLMAIANNETLSMEERFTARLKLAELPRNSANERVRNSLRGDGASARQLPQAARCRVSRCASSARKGLIPGLVKSSW